MSRLLPLLLVAAPAVAAEPAPPPRLLPDETGFPAALRTALGDHFEFLGGEPGTARGEYEMIGRHRFWFAKLRARQAGLYRLEYTAKLDSPVPNSFRPGDVAEDIEYSTYIVVGAPGTKRVFQPQMYAGSTFPSAVVGDTLVLPIHTDAGRSRHRFAPVRWEAFVADADLGPLAESTYRDVVRDSKGSQARVGAAPGLTVVNAPRLVLKSWPEEDVRRWVYAYLRFAAPGTFDLAPRLAHESPGLPGRMSFDALIRSTAAVRIPPISFRVVPRGQPVTVLLASFGTMHYYRGGGGDGSSEQLEYGTLEARVGDSVLLDCGISDRPPAGAPGHDAVVEALPFREVPHYEPR